MTRKRMEHLIYAGIALSLAVLLWLYVVGQKEREWSYPALVSLRLASSEVTGRALPEKVSLIVKGPRRAVDQMQGNRRVVRLVVNEIVAGEYTRSLLPSMVNDDDLPPGVEIVRIEPSEVTVELKAAAIRHFKVVARVVEADSAVRLAGLPLVQPEYVELRGAGNLDPAITEIATRPIEVTGPPGVKSVDVELDPPSGVSVLPPRVMVSFTVRERGADTAAMAPVVGSDTEMPVGGGL